MSGWVGRCLILVMMTSLAIVGLPPVASLAVDDPPCDQTGVDPSNPKSPPVRNSSLTLLVGDSGMLLGISAEQYPICGLDLTGLPASIGTVVPDPDYAADLDFTAAPTATKGTYSFHFFIRRAKGGGHPVSEGTVTLTFGNYKQPTVKRVSDHVLQVKGHGDLALAFYFQQEPNSLSAVSIIPGTTRRYRTQVRVVKWSAWYTDLAHHDIEVDHGKLVMHRA